MNNQTLAFLILINIDVKKYFHKIVKMSKIQNNVLKFKILLVIGIRLKRNANKKLLKTQILVKE